MTTTKIIPAIDLKDGQCVRLEQGRFDSTRVYTDDPLSLAREYANAGVDIMHLVDLDAAQGAGKNNAALVRDIAGSLDVSLQVGGGLRQREQVSALFDAGADRVVIGSLAIKDAAKFKRWIATFGAERIVLALDVDQGDAPRVHIHGWQDATDVMLWDALTEYVALGICHVLCTDISRDGMQTGPSVALYAKIMARYPDLLLQASGGVRNADDLRQLGECDVPFAISGRALLDGTLSLSGARG